MMDIIQKTELDFYLTGEPKTDFICDEYASVIEWLEATPNQTLYRIIFDWSTWTDGPDTWDGGKEIKGVNIHIYDPKLAVLFKLRWC